MTASNPSYCTSQGTGLHAVFLSLTYTEQSQQNFVYFTSKDAQEPIYGYTARTTGKGALRTKSFRQPSRTSGASGPKRLSELTAPHTSLPGNSEDISQSSPSRSSKMSGSSGEHVYEELPGVRKTTVSCC